MADAAGGSQIVELQPVRRSLTGAVGRAAAQAAPGFRPSLPLNAAAPAAFLPLPLQNHELRMEVDWGKQIHLQV